MGTPWGTWGICWVRRDTLPLSKLCLTTLIVVSSPVPLTGGRAEHPQPNRTPKREPPPPPPSPHHHHHANIFAAHTLRLWLGPAGKVIHATGNAGRTRRTTEDSFDHIPRDTGVRVSKPRDMQRGAQAGGSSAELGHAALEGRRGEDGTRLARGTL